MAKFEKTGLISLDGKLINQDLWTYLQKGIVNDIEDFAVIPIDTGIKGRVKIKISQIISPDQNQTQFVPQNYYNASLSVEQNKKINNFHTSMADIFSVIASNKWILVGEIIQKNGIINIMIIYFQDLNVYYYSLISQEQRQIINKTNFYLN